MPGFLDRSGTRGFGFNDRPTGSALRGLSRLGMKYDDLVIRNSRAIGVAEDAYGYSMYPMGDSDDMWYTFAALSLTDTSMKKNIPSIYNKQYKEKVKDLRDFALQDEIEDILDILTDECLIPDTKNFFCKADFLGEGLKEEITESLEANFKKIYSYFSFNDGLTAWNYFRKWLIDGFLAFEIIYDSPNNEKNIIGFKELDPNSLVPGINKEDNKRIWVQHKGGGQKERQLYDSQIIFISYSSINSPSRISYVERLIRSFNLLRIMETTRIIWAVTNSASKMKFVIPVGGKSKTRAKQSLAQLMHSYREVVDFDYTSGELKFNGKPMMPFSKEYWFPSKDGETPEVEAVAGDGPEISDTEAVKYFSDKLKMVSKIPFNRFDKDSPAGYEVAAEGMLRDEIRFSRFVNRLRSTFKEILVKPLYIQMILDHPELADDISFKTSVSIKFNSDNIFEEQKQIELSNNRLDYIDKMKAFSEISADGNEDFYWDLDFLMHRYGGFTEDDLKTNLIYKKVKTLEKEGYSSVDARKIAYGENKNKFKILQPTTDTTTDLMGGGSTDALSDIEGL